MTPGARIQAAIELLDEIVAAARTGGAAADTLVARYFAARRYAGSKDRRAVRELVYAAIRRAGEGPASGRAAMLGLADEDTAVAAAFDGSPHGPAPIAADEPRARAGIAPAWLEAALDRSAVPRAGWPALVDRAPLDVRVNTLRIAVAEAEAALPGAARVPGVPDALRLPTGTAIERHPLFLDGGVEVQDAGSQMIALAAAAEPGMTVVDLCAGAGGKTLALAAAMRGRGRADRLRHRSRAAVAPRAPRGAGGSGPHRHLPARSRPRAGGDGRSGGAGGRGAGRCALLGHRHLAAQSGGALAADARRGSRGWWRARCRFCGSRARWCGRAARSCLRSARCWTTRARNRSRRWSRRAGPRSRRPSARRAAPVFG